MKHSISKSLSKILCLLVFFLSFLIIYGISKPQKVYAAYPNGYDYRREITIHYQYVYGSGSYTNFPVMINFTNASLKTTSNGGNVTNSSGYDIIFETTSGTQLDHEMEYYSSSTGEIIAWVRIPSLSTSSDTDIYIYYGNSSISSSQEDIDGVWANNFAAVYHMDETGGTIYDSTSNNNDLIGGSYYTGGKLDGGEDYNIDDNNSTTGHDSSLNLGSSLTLSAWIRPESWGETDSLTGYDKGTIIYKPSTAYDLSVQDASAIDGLTFHSGSTTVDTGTSAISLNSWQYVGASINGTSGFLWVDNSTYNVSPSSPSDSTSALNVGSGPLEISFPRRFDFSNPTISEFIILTVSSNTSPMSSDNSKQLEGSGGGGDKSWAEEFNGQMDEVRIIDDNRSSDWLKTEYYNQENPGQFHTLGSEESLAWWNSSWLYRIPIVVDHTKVDQSFNEFPVYVDLSDMPSAFHSHVKSDGGDIRLTEDDGVTSVPREVVFYDSSTDTGEVHFKGDISSTTDTTFYLYYGNSSASDLADSHTYGAENVWSRTSNGSYDAVYHLHESGNGTTDEYKDSTSNDWDGKGGTSAYPTQITGKLGNGQEFNGSNDYIALKKYYSNTYIGRLAASAWAKVPSTGGDWSIVDFDRSEFYTCAAGIPNSSAGGEGDYLGFHTKDGNSGSIYDMWSSQSGIRNNSWRHITWVYYSQYKYMYIDGSQDSNTQYSMGLGRTDSTRYGVIGNGSEASSFNGSMNSNYFEGSIDELRITDTDAYTTPDTTDAQWISTEYNNQSSPSTFYSVGSEDAPNYAPTITNISINSGNNINLTENGTTQVTLTATVTDPNGYGDIQSTSGKVYRSGVSGAQSCTENDQNCYTPPLSLQNCSGDSCTVAGAVYLYYFADSTDASGDYPTEYWRGYIYASDGEDSDTAFTASGSPDVNSLIALDLGNNISYGSYSMGQNSGSNNTTLEVINTGNTEIDTEIKGDNMCLDYPTCSSSTIGVGYQEYSSTTFTYGSGTDLTSSYVGLTINLVKNTSSSSSSSTDIYWGIGIPTGISLGSYTGKNYLTATDSS